MKNQTSPLRGSDGHALVVQILTSSILGFGFTLATKRKASWQLSGKNILTANAGEAGTIPGSGRSSREGNDKLLHDFRLGKTSKLERKLVRLQSMGLLKNQI